MASFLSDDEFDALIEGKGRRSAIAESPTAGVNPLADDDDLDEARSVGSFVGDRRRLDDRQILQILRAELKNADPERVPEIEREIRLVERRSGAPAPAARAIQAEAVDEGGWADPNDPAILKRRGQWPPKREAPKPEAPKPEEEPGLTHRAFRDTGLDVAKGVVGVGESAVGIADLATYGYAGKALEAIGYDPKRAGEMLSEMYTPQRKRANQNVEAAKGFFETAGALFENPSALLGTIAESAPGMIGIVGGGRMLAANIFMKAAQTTGGVSRNAAGKILLSPEAQAAGRAAVEKAIPKIAAASAAGEGALGAGSIAEQARQAGREWEQYVLPSIGAGVTTAGISMASAGLGRTKVGQKLGLGDIETGLATRGLGEAGEQVAGGRVRQAIKSGVGGAISEGVIEELPQSMSEQAFGNVAQGRPVGEGVPEAGATGMLAGAGMGGPIALYRGATRRPQAPPAAAGAPAGAEAAPAAPAAAPAAGAPPAPGQIDPATGEAVPAPEILSKDELLDRARKDIEDLAARARKEPVVGQDAEGPYVEGPAPLNSRETKMLDDLRALTRTNNLEALATFYGVELAGAAPAAPAAVPAPAAPAAAPTPALIPEERDAEFEDIREFATPKAKEDLKAAGLNILDVTPTGKFGRITEEDVQRSQTGRQRAQLRGVEAPAPSEPSAALGEPEVAPDPATVDPILAELGHKSAATEDMPDASTPTRIEVRGKQYDATRIGKREYAQLQRFAKLFGKELVLFENPPGAQRWDDGFIHPKSNKHVFLSSVAQGAPHMVLFGHELMHAMERDLPAVWGKLKKSIIKVARPDAVEKMKEDYKSLLQQAPGEKPYTEAQAEEIVWQEIVSDLGGNRLQEVETWKKIFRGLENHGMVRRVASYVRDMIGRVINFAKKQKDTGFVTDAYVNDLNAVRDAVADAAIEYIRVAQKPPKVAAEKKVVGALAQARAPPAVSAGPPEALQRPAPTAKAPAPLVAVPPAPPSVGKIEEAKPAAKAKPEPRAPETPLAKAKREQAELKVVEKPAGKIRTVDQWLEEYGAKAVWNSGQDLTDILSGINEDIEINAEPAWRQGLRQAALRVEKRIDELRGGEPLPSSVPPAEPVEELPEVFVLEDWKKANPRPTIRKATRTQISALPDNVRSPYKNAITNYAAAVASAYGQALKATAPQETLDVLRGEFEWAADQIEKQFPKAQYDSFRKHTKAPDDYDLDPEYVDQLDDERGEGDPVANAQLAEEEKKAAAEKSWTKLPKEVTATADGFPAIGPPVKPEKLGLKMFGTWQIYREIKGIKKGDIVVAARPGKKARTGTVGMVGVVSEEGTNDGKPISQIAVWFDEEMNDGDMFEVGMVTMASSKDYPSKEMIAKLEEASLHDFPVKNDTFPAPKKTVQAEDKAKKTHGIQKVKGKERAKFISQAEAKKLLEVWKAEADRISRDEDHSNDVIFSLFDYSGQWSQPWVDAGYHVIKYDVKTGDDLLAFLPTADIVKLKAQGKRIVGVLAAPPCTSFTSTGNQWWPTQHDVPVKEATMTEKYGFAANKYFDTPLDYAKTLFLSAEAFISFAAPERFHVAENPVGRIKRVTGLPEPLLNMQPHHYGDAYTKNTLLWGDFNPDLPTANVDPSIEGGGQGSLMHRLGSKAEAEGGERSLTPEGFAYAFFMANRHELKKPVQKAVSASRVKRSGIRENLAAIRESLLGEHSQAEAYEKQHGVMPYTPAPEIVVPVNGRVQRSGIRKNVRRNPFGLERNFDGTVTLYHATSNERARRARQDRALRAETPRSKRIKLTTAPRTGEADVQVYVDPNLLHLEREHADGRKDFFIPVKEGEAFDRKIARLQLTTLTVSREKAISADRTIATIGQGITKAVAAIQKMSPAERKQNLARAREVLRREHNVGTLLTENGKLEKTRINELGLTYNGLPVASMGLGMASAQRLNEQRLTTCPQSARCESLCLGDTAGQNMLYGGEGAARSGPRLSQYLKTEALVLHPEEFTAQLMSEIDALIRWAASPVETEITKGKRVTARKDIYQPAVRVNVTTDFPAKMWAAMISAYPKVMFYDYTKLLGQKSIAPNHHITFSSNGASQVVNGKVIRAPGNNWGEMVKKLRAGSNVAMAFDNKEEIPGFIRDEASGETFQVHDGDDYDARFLDPKRPDGIGMIVGLRNKDRTGPASTATEREHGFFIHYDAAMGDTVTIPDQAKLERKTITIMPRAAMPAPVEVAVPEARAPPRRTEYFLTEQGPRLSGERIQLRNPQLAPVQLNPRANSYQHEIRVDGKLIGNLTLGWRGREIVTLPWVQMHDDQQGKGYGEELIADLVNHNAGRDILVQNITDDAKGFWRKMGTEFFEDGGTHGDLSKSRYDQARAARTGARPEGEGAGALRQEAGTGVGEEAPAGRVAGADRGEPQGRPSDQEARPADEPELGRVKRTGVRRGRGAGAGEAADRGRLPAVEDAVAARAGVPLGAGLPGRGGNVRRAGTRAWPAGPFYALSRGPFAPGIPSSGLGTTFTVDPELAAAHGDIGKPTQIGFENPKYIPVRDIHRYTATRERAAAFARELLAEGYDGLVISAAGVGGPDYYVVLDRARVQRSGVRTTSPTEPPSIPPVPWYSELSRKIEAGPNSAPAAVWKGYINGLKQKGVKPEEIEWSGILEHLDVIDSMKDTEPKGPVKITKAMLLDYLKQNGVQVDENVLGGTGASVDVSFGQWKDDEPDFEMEAKDLYMDQARETLQRDRDAHGNEEPVTDEEVLEGALQLARGAFYDDPERPSFKEIEAEVRGKTYKFIASQSFGDFDLFAPANQGNELDADGGKSIPVYGAGGGGRRTLPDNPQIERAIKAHLAGTLGIDFDQEAPPFESYTLPGGENYAVTQLQLPAKFAERGYPSPHFDEPNILAHVRHKDRKDTDGKSVLFIEEIQSDWAQEGREKGFTDPLAERNWQEYTKTLLPRYEEKLAQETAAAGMELEKAKALASKAVRKAGPWDLTFEKMAAFLDETDKHRALVEARSKSREGIPNAPFVKKTDAWVALALKKMMMKAVDEGYDKIAWTTGNQQADRYNLSKYISEVMAKRQPGGKVWMQAKDKNGRVVIADDFEKEKLPGVIGKEMASKIIRATELTAKTLQYTGLALEVGGEGMKTFYDQIVPKVANEQLKKLGGDTKVGEVAIPNLDKPSNRNFFVMVDGEVADRTSTRKAALESVQLLKKTGTKGSITIEPIPESQMQPGFDITPELKASLAKGVPLFSRLREGTAARAEALAKTQFGATSLAAIEAFNTGSAEVLATAKNGKVTVSVLADPQQQRWPHGRADHILEHDDYPGFPVPAGRWMDSWEPYMKEKAGVSEKAYDKLSEKERAAIEAKNQADVYAGRQFFDGFAEFYLADEYARWFKGAAKRNPNNPRKGSEEYWKPIIEQRFGRVKRSGLRSQTETPAFKKWFGTSKVVDENGEPLRVFHGTTADFSTFDNRRGNVEADFGAGFYFTNNPRDVAANYAGEGPDLTNKIERRAEQLAQDMDDDMEAARTKARAEFSTHAGMTMPVYLSIKNPVILGGKDQTVFDYNIEYDDDGNVQDETGSLVAMVLALRDAAGQYRDGNVEPAIGKMLELGMDGGLNASGVVNILKDDEQFGYFTDDRGELVSNEITRQAFERAGFDGVIDNTVNDKFGSTRRVGRQMAGMDENTVHYVTFQPQQIKSAIGNVGTFDPRSPDIRRSGIRGERDRFSAYDELPAREQLPPYRATELNRLPIDVISNAYYALKEGAPEQEVIEILDAMNVPDVPAALARLKRSGIRSLRTKAAVSMSNATIIPDFLRATWDLGADLMRPTEKGEFNWWHRTFGTQFHKAMVNPHFKRVFDLALKFIDDISMFAIRAEKMAPSIFPSMGQFSLSWKRGIGVGLDKANNALIGRALAEGTLNGKDANPHDGKVWTDAELISRYSMTPAQINSYREARAAINQSLADTAKALMGQVARTGGAPQNVIDAVLQQYQQLDKARDELLSAMPPSKKALQAEGHVAKIYGETMSLMAHGYSPLMRFGKYTVEVRRRNTLDPKKYDTLFFSLHETKAERDRMEKAVRADPKFQGLDISAGEMNEQQHKLFNGISLDSMEAFVNAMPYTNEQEQAARQEYISLALTSRSALSRMTKRKGIEGYSLDATRTLASFITSNARYGSRAVNGAPMLAAAANIPKGQGNVASEATLLRDYVMNPKEGAAKFRGFLFFQFLGASIAAGLVNLTQPVLMTFPYLSQFGMRRAARAMTAATKDVYQWSFNKAVPDQGLNDALKRAAARGITEPQEIFQMMAAARTGTGSFLGAKFMRLWGANFAVTEVFNRTITFAAAFRMGRELPNTDPYEFAVKAVQDSQGLYNKANRPNLARETGAAGTLGTVAFTFKQYSIAYVEFLKRLYGDGLLPKPAFLLALGLLWLAAGAEGEPGSEDFDDLMETVWGWMGRPLNMKKEKRRFLRETLGFSQGAADFTLQGISAFMPMDVQARLGMHNLIPGTAMFNPARQDEVAGETLEVLGVTGGFAKTVGESFGKLKKGEVGGAVKTVLPKALRDIVQAYDMWTTGKMVDKGDRLVMPATKGQAVVRAFGFNPAAAAQESELLGQLHTDKKIIQSKKAEWHGRLAKAIAEGDTEAREAVIREREAWVRRFPDYPITINWPAVQRRAREMQRTRAERFIKSAPRELRREARETLIREEE